MAADDRFAKPALRAPGAASARLYVWLVLWSPLVLLGASIGLTLLGLWQESEGVATIGALGVVASLILPRMRGPFKFGPGGIEGGLWDDFFEEVMRQGTARGLPESETEEVAADVAGDLAESLMRQWRNYVLHGRGLQTPRSAVDPIAVLLHALAEKSVEGAVGHKAVVEEVVRRVADKRGWRVADAELRYGHDNRRRADVVIETDDGLVFIESKDVMRTGNSLLLLRHDMGLEKQRRGARAAFVVVPDGAEIASGELEGTQLLKLNELEDALLQL